MITDLTDYVQASINESTASRYMIARSSGVSQAVISRFMAGKQTITLSTATRLLVAVDGLVGKPRIPRGRGSVL